MIIVNAFIELKEDKVQDFMKSAEKLVEETRKEEGCIFYTLYADPKNSRKLVMVEVWASRPAFDLHITLPHFLEHVKEVKDMLAVPTELKLYEAKEIQL